MAGTSQASMGSITLKGSTTIVAEFFHYCVNSILYQRGLYPPETFTREQKYGLTLLVTADDALKSYLTTMFSHLQDWLQKMVIQKLVLAITDADTNEVLERWQFDVQCDKTAAAEADSKPKVKSVNEINKEICAIIRQITASMTFLPLLEAKCAFDLLVYTDKDLDLPDDWGDSGPRFIANSEEVRLRSFSTLIHKVDAMVSYKKKEI